ncbi:MAG: Helicase PriA essential for oriC/DnaA-independent replication [Myxococcaceae bacterium]|nr:Helicase PriA essential for oriC/DnaA-independent replication [Myxococcaceae bacterium]
MSSRFADIALPVPLRRSFTYRIPETLVLEPGVRVAVPFSGQKLAGIVLRVHDEEPVGLKRISNVAGRFEPEPIFPEELLRFLLRAADYYLSPLGEVLKAAAPALPKEAIDQLKHSGFVDDARELKGRHISVKKTLRVRRIEGALTPPRAGTRQRMLLALLEARGEILLSELNKLVPEGRAAAKKLAAQGVVALEEVTVASDPFYAEALPREQPFRANAEQQHAIDVLSAALSQKQPGTFLLHGVTGSGKTEVYLHVVARALEQGGGALVLVPEIALTPQLVARFRARFGEGIAVLHSGLTDRERHRAWLALRRGELRLAVGARSALFAPVPRLSVIIVDEEHDSSFKQEEGFRYQGRDMAMLRAQMAGALCVLGSATPSVETYYLSEQNRVTKLELKERAQAQLMPKVEVVDLARYPGVGPSGHPLLSAPLHRAIEQCLAAGDQAILFLNRRGFAPSLACASCTEVLRCPACSVSLTEHRRAGLLRCHYCDFTTPVTEACPACGELALQRVGVGTERIEDALTQSFRGARVGRLDRDTAAGRGVEEVLDKMRQRELDILVGTQMVTKGHDLPGVTLVGVLQADQSLTFPDFRASERTFQLLAQVSGRAGRGERPGRVLLQTKQEHHYAVRSAIQHDYLSFYREEIAARREMLYPYPPLSRLAAVRADAGDEVTARRIIGELANVAQRTPEVQAHEVAILGPAPAPVERIRGRWRMRFLLRARSREKLRAVAALVAERIDQGVSPGRAHLDIDPVSMM